MSMSGWGTLTGEAHYTLSSLAHSNDKDKKMGAFNVLGYKNPEMDKLLQDAAIEMDEAKRRGLLEKANELVLKDRQRLPIVAVGSAWAMQKDKVKITAARRRRHARHEHQAGEVTHCFETGADAKCRRPRSKEIGTMAPIAIGIHGGCGTLDVSLMSEAEWAEARDHLAESLRAGWAILARVAAASMPSRRPSL